MTYLHSIYLGRNISFNNTDDSGGIYKLFTVTKRGPPQYLNKTLCFWGRRIINGDIVSGRQSNGTCSPTFEKDTTSETI